MWTRRTFLQRLSTLPLVGGAATARLAAAPAAATARDYFKELGVRPFINAAGTYTAMTASLMPPEVMNAINYASRHFVMLDELHDRIGERIATLIRNEAAMVTSGAASALTLGTAAILTGLDAARIVALPDLASGMKSEVIIQKSHRFGYDHAVRNCGVRWSRSRARRTGTGDQRQDRDDALLQQQQSEGQIQDEAFVQLGKKHNVPTLNDAAADVPPVENLWKYTAMGFDLVAISGGKGLRGPQSAGLLLGRKDLIAAARLNAPPNGNTIGRGMKVNKEEMLGMLAAVELYVRRITRPNAVSSTGGRKPSAAAQHRCRASRRKRSSRRSPTTSRTSASVVGGQPRPEGSGFVKAMRDGDPSIGTRSENESLVIGVWMMQPGEDDIVARRLKQVLAAKA